MGEYAHRVDGRHVKIGTCEDMLYLRFDQLDQIAERDPHSLDPRDPAIWGGIRFRFPFPHEDGIAVGEFNDPDYSVPVPGLYAPDIEHRKVQFVASQGFNVMLPCPLSTEGALLQAEADLRIFRNGFGGEVRIVQQRVLNGRLVLVAECGGCRSRYRYPTLEDVEPVLYWIGKTVAELKARDEGDGRATWWRTIADRIRAGYTDPPPAVAATATTGE